MELYSDNPASITPLVVPAFPARVTLCYIWTHSKRFIGTMGYTTTIMDSSLVVGPTEEVREYLENGRRWPG